MQSSLYVIRHACNEGLPKFQIVSCRGASRCGTISSRDLPSWLFPKNLFYREQQNAQMHPRIAKIRIQQPKKFQTWKNKQTNKDIVVFH